MQQLLGRRFIFGENTHARQSGREIGEYFQGVRQRLSVALHAPAAQFQEAAWATPQRIPCGASTHYEALAESIGYPAAARAVASANRIAIIVPCRRAIGKNGSLVGYGGGLQRKRWLLEHEREPRHGDAAGWIQRVI